MLCSRNQSDSLLPALQALLKRDVDLEATYSGYNSLNLLLRFYRQENLFRCASLLIKRGVRVNETDRDGQKPIFLLCRFYAGEDLIDVCRLLVSRNMVDTATALQASFILTDRGLHEESIILEKMTQYGEFELNEVSSILPLDALYNFFFNFVYLRKRRNCESFAARGTLIL